MTEKLNPFEEVPEPEEPERPPEALEPPVEADPRARRRSLAGLGLLVLFQAAQLGAWLHADSRPPGRDASLHLRLARDARDAARSLGLREALLRPPAQGLPTLPPLYQLSLAPVMGTQDPAAGALWVNLLYMTLLCAAAWGLGSHFAGEWAGLGAAVFVSCLPGVQELLREQRPDLALTAWVAAAYWALAASRSFRRVGPACLFGLACSAAMLTQGSAAAYLLPAFLSLGLSLRDKWRRGGAAAALSVAALLTAPWYLVHGPAFAPEALAAALRGTESFWKDYGVFAYLSHMSRGMEAPAFLVGLASLAVPTKRRRHSDTVLLYAWFVSSYALCTLVPNRQFRLLLPGLVPLGVLAMGPWPKSLLVGLGAFQLASAVNFSGGWLPRQELQAGLPLSVFASRPPAKEEWRVGDILREAAGLHDKTSPFGSLTVVADHPSFNAATFGWEERRLGVEQVRAREAGRRVCEFSEFVVSKTGSLGPPGRAEALEKVREELLAPEGWLAKGYREARRWPLPDGGEAVLFARRRLEAPPFPEGPAAFAYFEEAGVAVEDLRLDLGRWDAQRGLYPRVTVRAKRVAAKGVDVDGLSLVLEDVSMVSSVEANLRDPDWMKDTLSDVRFLRLGRLSVLAGSLGEASLAGLLKLAVPGVSAARVSLKGDVSIRARWRGLPVDMTLRPALADQGRGLTAQAERLRLLGLPLPSSLLPRYRADLEPGPEHPFSVVIPSLSATGGRLRVGG